MQDQNNSQESNRIGVGIFIVIVIILLILAGAAGVYYASLKQEKPKDLSDTTVKSFDLMEESKMVHRTVDDVLLMKRENWQLRDTGRRQHKDLLEVSGADVVWTDREVAVGVPVTTELEGASRWVQEHLRTTDVKTIREEKSKWHGMEAWRLDVGIAVKSGKDNERNFTTDTIFFFHHGNLTNRDRDIPRIPKEERRNDEKSRTDDDRSRNDDRSRTDEGKR
ncbi:MAG: hypothetical protein IJP51_08410 [Acidaminococcaceae bacterium]|jgi:hypothetical protein|nr:hypothetical protein [Acidaminococcaceae bacterium]MBQ8700374.1 hypothetical protein [Acidaminococcaceae bacterium]MBR6816980.1 hypothetical protein [Acidaminococcaceae bacterium]MEE3395824.1 hypothetical protein [Succiniclasticum sp.]